jgi:hypothetical protein
MVFNRIAMTEVFEGDESGGQICLDVAGRRNSMQEKVCIHSKLFCTFVKNMGITARTIQ